MGPIPSLLFNHELFYTFLTWSLILRYSGAHSFGHFEKWVLFKSRTFTSWLKSAGSEKREVGRFCWVLVVLDKARTFHIKSLGSSCICEKREVVPRAVKSARYPALLTKSSKTRPTLKRGISRTFSGQKCGISRALKKKIRPKLWARAKFFGATAVPATAPGTKNKQRPAPTLLYCTQYSKPKLMLR
jgi:hypothetical protein